MSVATFLCDCGACRAALPSLNRPHYTPYQCNICDIECHGLPMPGALCWDCWTAVSYLFSGFMQGWHLAQGRGRSYDAITMDAIEPRCSAFAREVGDVGGPMGEDHRKSGDHQTSADEPIGRSHRDAVGSTSCYAEAGGRYQYRTRGTTPPAIGAMGPVARVVGRSVVSKSWRAWTTAEVRRLRMGMENGDADRVIAHEMGRTVESVKTKKRELRRAQA